MSKVLTQQEHARNHRRVRRQILGAVIVALVLVGLMTIVRAGFGMVAALFDDTEARQEYQKKLEGLVMFDPLPFDGIANIEDRALREAAVWGCVYSIQETQGGFDRFERDPETEQMLLPAVEVDAYLAKLLGKTFRMNHQSFEMEDMSITYSESAQSYLIPVTGGVGSYRASVTALFREGGKLHVTVGYIPLTNSEDITVSTSDRPTKYMDYLFERISGNWILTGLTESATKPEALPVPEENTNPVVMMSDEELQSAIMAGVNGEEEPVETPAPEPTEEPENGETEDAETEAGAEEAEADAGEAAESTEAAGEAAPAA